MVVSYDGWGLLWTAIGHCGATVFSFFAKDLWRVKVLISHRCCGHQASTSVDHRTLMRIEGLDSAGALMDWKTSMVPSMFPIGIARTGRRMSGIRRGWDSCKNVRALASNWLEDLQEPSVFL